MRYAAQSAEHLVAEVMKKETIGQMDPIQSIGAKRYGNIGVP